jgi:hypothetical protein
LAQIFTGGLMALQVIKYTVNLLTSAGCCLGTTSDLWASLPGKYLAFFGRSRMTRDWRYQEHIASPVNTVRSFYWQDRLFDWHKVEGAPVTYLCRTSRQVSHGRAEY